MSSNAQITEKGEKKYKYFDLDTFESKEETVPYEFTPAVTIEDAHARINGDDSIILKAINAYLKAQLFASLENAVVSKGGRRSAVLSACKPFRSFPPFNNPALYPDTKEGRKAQTDAILSMLKTNEAIINSIKLASQNPTEGEENDSDE